MRLPLPDIPQLAKQIQDTKTLAEPTTVASVLKGEAKFATIAFCAEVTGKLESKNYGRPGGRLKVSGWEGLDENNILVGYLSHNGTNLKFQTKDTVIFDLPFNGLQVESHSLGLIIKTTAKTYAIGNFMAINEELSPASKMNYHVGSEATIWMRELGDLGAIDKAAWQKSQSNAKRFILLWFTMIIVGSILVLLLALR